MKPGALASRERRTTKLANWKTELFARLRNIDLRKFDYVPDGSIDLILTDPPYQRSDLPLFGALAEFSTRVLRRGGSLLCYVGNIYIPQVIEMLSKQKGLTYVWQYALRLPGPNLSTIRIRKIEQGWKPILHFVKGDNYYPSRLSSDVLVSPAREKGLHPWQQNLVPLLNLVNRFSKPGQFVCDPFLGSGTTALAALKLSRNFAGCEINPVTFAKAVNRVTGGGWEVEFA